jgi:hypothetical protein
MLGAGLSAAHLLREELERARERVKEPRALAPDAHHSRELRQRARRALALVDHELAAHEAAPGHHIGPDLPAADKQALIAFLKTL